MLFFLDSIDIEEIEFASRYNLAGVTTNPSLFIKALTDAKYLNRNLDSSAHDLNQKSKDFNEIFNIFIKNLIKIAKNNKIKLFHIQVLSSEYNAIIKEANIILKIAKQFSYEDHIVIKIPTTMDGIKALYDLSCFNEHIKTNLTLCMSTSQAIIAGIHNATFISPFVGRLEDEYASKCTEKSILNAENHNKYQTTNKDTIASDFKSNGLKLAQDIKTAFNNYNKSSKDNFKNNIDNNKSQTKINNLLSNHLIDNNINNTYIKTKILASSIRTLKHIEECMIIGVDSITMNFALFNLMLNNTLTRKYHDILVDDIAKYNLSYKE